MHFTADKQSSLNIEHFYFRKTKSSRSKYRQCHGIDIEAQYEFNKTLSQEQLNRFLIFSFLGKLTLLK